jgi:hypothetical protein
MKEYRDNNISSFLAGALIVGLVVLYISRKSPSKHIITLDNSFEKRLLEIERATKEGTGIGLVSVGLAVIALGIAGLTMGANLFVSIILLLLGLFTTIFGVLKIPPKRRNK